MGSSFFAVSSQSWAHLVNVFKWIEEVESVSTLPKMRSTLYRCAKLNKKPFDYFTMSESKFFEFGYTILLAMESDPGSLIILRFRIRHQHIEDKKIHRMVLTFAIKRVGSTNGP